MKQILTRKSYLKNSLIQWSKLYNHINDKGLTSTCEMHSMQAIQVSAKAKSLNVVNSIVSF